MQHLARIFGWCLLLVSFRPAAALKDHQPYTQDNGNSLSTAPVRRQTDSVAGKSGHDKPGLVNCRSWDRTNKEVNYYTCVERAKFYEMTLDFFFLLNPDLNKDFSNI